MELTLEHYLEKVKEQRVLEEGMGTKMASVAIVSALVGSLVGASVELSDSKDDIIEDFKEDESAQFDVGKHTVILKIGNNDKIIYTTQGNTIMILIPETMDKDDALQEIEEIIMKIKRQNNM